MRGFDVKVLAHDKYKSGFGTEFVRESTLESIYQNADVLSFHIPVNAETIHYFNEAFLDHFHKPIFLLNVARGKIVKTEAVVKGLQTGLIKGAGLDVHEIENAAFNVAEPNEYFSFLCSHPRVLLTPHVAGWTKESYYKLSKVLSDKIIEHYFSI